ncbi:non-ribosomal peptide synthetase [Catenuloplanes japonicus]|uniref:non-ribosomal peptide synthetase n=1 Tax=Catenuloplanes japonicus TaxID=33876 RepID=UPI000525B309|nr:non-ribosomal peptide synthetase [Catenuloplanes japonicus]
MTFLGASDATNLIDAFERVAHRHPDAIAVTFEGRHTTYRELHRRAHVLSAAVRQAAGETPARVMVLLPRSDEVIVSFLAVLRAGHAYVPVDPHTPPARIAVTAEDAAPALVVASAETAGAVPAGIPRLLIEDVGENSGPAVTADQPGPASPAYVIYTSGTTGRPKGVVVTHANVLRLFTTTQPLFGFGPTDVWSLLHSFAFDFSVWEMWGPLLSGGRVVVAGHDTTRNPALLRELLQAERVTMLSQTPTAFSSLMAHETALPDRLSLRWVVFGGEALRPRDLRPWVTKYGHQAPALVNMYGITETTVHASYRRIRSSDLDSAVSPIGRPLPDLEFRLHDADGQPVADGDPGEIVITGAGVAAGYLGLPELTAERFPAGAYRSGDLARRTADGEYEYLGRADEQVKIRGYRIELGDIRAVLATVPGVHAAAVVVRQPAPPRNPVVATAAPAGEITTVRRLVRGEDAVAWAADRTPKIVAYVRTGDGFRPPVLFEQLREQLPPYMVPAFVVPVDALPVNANGKIDVARLPAPSAANRLREDDPDRTTAPASGDALLIAELFERVLAVEGVGVDDSFFSVGGDSILVVQLRTAAAARGLDLDIADIYTLQTPRLLAETAGQADATPAAAVAAFSLISDDDRQALPSDVTDAYPLARLQAGVMFHSAYAEGVNMYCDIFMFRLRVPFDERLLRRALERVVVRHDILRTSFHLAGYSEPLQLVHTTATAPLSVTDLRDLAGEDQQHAFERWRAAEMHVPYDWETAPLVRFTVHLLGTDEFMLSMSFHDAMFDGWSETSLLAELLTDYWRFLSGDEEPRPVPARRYADFIALEQATLHDPQARRFWEQELADVEPTLLPLLAGGSADVHAGRMGFLAVEVPPVLSERIAQLAAASEVSVKHVLMAVHARVVMTLTGQEDLLIGVASNGRVEADGGTEVIGLHLNLVPHRFQPRGNTWRELVAAAAAKERQLLPVRRFPHAEILRVARQSELTDIMFNYTHFHGYEQIAHATGIEVLDGFGYIQTNFTLRAEFNRDPFTRLLSLDLEANLERVSAPQLRMIAEIYRNALHSVVDEPDLRPSQRRLLGEDAWAAELALSHGPADTPHDSGFVPVFDRAVTAHADRIAAICADRSISYRELGARVDTATARLRAGGVSPGTIVGLAAVRDIDYLVVFLAVLRCGAVYLPLPDGPVDRIRRMVRRAEPAVIVCDERFGAAVRESVRDTVSVPVRDLADVLADGDPGEIPRLSPPRPRDPAYVLFTSGSTGEPKGALIRHDGFLNHLQAKIDEFGLGPGDRVSQDAAATFDISIWQLVAPLAVGATTVIYPDEIGQDAPRLLRAVADDRVTVLEVTPSVLNVFNAELDYYGPDTFRLDALRYVASQAETLTPLCANTFRRLLPHVTLLNMWGLTETSDDCLHHRVESHVDEQEASVPIGRPLRNMAVYVLNADREPVPAGTPGELYVGGVCVGAGYINDPDRTAAAFVPDPFAGGDALIYRTGDRGRRRADGSLEFLARFDNQVKIRGNRVEVDEVVRALAGVDGVQESAVVVRPAPDGGRQLVGFYVPTVADQPARAGIGDGVVRRDLATDEVRAALARTLPRFAIPDLLLAVQALPRTTHGKVDRRLLEQWAASAHGGTDSIAADAADLTATEAAVADVWAAVLKTSPPGPATDFFDLGGHSLHATQVLARLRDRFPVTLPVRLLFENPTVRALAAQIDARLAESDRPAPAALTAPVRITDLDEFPLTMAQSSLWYLNQLDPDDTSYESGYLLDLRGPLRVAELCTALDVITGHNDALSARIIDRDGVPFQISDPAARLRLEQRDAPDALAGAGTDAVLDHVRQRRTSRRFDLSTGPLTVAVLHRFSDERHVLEWSGHHIVTDGWSNELIIRQLREAYEAALDGRLAPAPPSLRYGDFAVWQEQYLRTPQAEEQADFWRGYLDGYSGELDLVTDHTRTDDRTRQAGRLRHRWDVVGTRRIADFVRGQGTTTFMFAHAVSAALAARLAQQSDVVIGAAVAGRTVPGTEEVVGFFANTLPFRYAVDRDVTARALLAAVRGHALEAMDHQVLPFQRIVDAVRAPRRPGVPPLVQVVVSVTQPLRTTKLLPDLAAEVSDLASTRSMFDLTLRFDDGDELGLLLEYDRSLFTDETARRLRTACVRLAESFVAAPDRLVRETVLIDDADRDALDAIARRISGGPLHEGDIVASAHWADVVEEATRGGLLIPLVLSL